MELFGDHESSDSMLALVPRPSMMDQTVSKPLPIIPPLTSIQSFNLIEDARYAGTTANHE
jgi:hypothetical protein